MGKTASHPFPHYKLFGTPEKDLTTLGKICSYLDSIQAVLHYSIKVQQTRLGINA